MDSIVVEGGHALSGTVEVGGSKNASLALMAGALLAGSPSQLERIPQLRDVATMTRLLECLGAVVRRNNGGLQIDPSNLQDVEAPYDLVSQMRASFYVLGPLLARFGHARVSLPGGCAIGPRPVDLTLRGMGALGAEITIDQGYVVAAAPTGSLVGADCNLEGPHGSSVGATCNVLMAATLAQGTSILRGVAREPHVDDLVNYLNAMGARIRGGGTTVLEVEGVNELWGTTHRVIPDQIEAGTLIVAAAMTHGDVTVTNCRTDQMKAELDELREMGVRFEVRDDAVHVSGDSPLRSSAIRTSPYPGFPTDLQAQFMAALCLADGETTVTDTIYPERFIHAMELNRMGADITVSQGVATVRGVKRLKGAAVMCSDLRASAALVLAGLCAEGRTECRRVYNLDRGYEKLEKKLSALGAVIERVGGRK